MHKHLDKRLEDVVDGSHRGQRHVEDGKVTLESVGDVILAASWLDHGCQEARIYDEAHVTNGLLQAVHAALLQQLPHNFICDLDAQSDLKMQPEYCESAC